MSRMRLAIPLATLLLASSLAWAEEPARPEARLREAVAAARTSGRSQQVAGEQHLLSEQSALRLRLSVDETRLLLEVEQVSRERADLTWRSALCLDGTGAVTSLSASVAGALNASVSARWDGNVLRWEELGRARRTGERRWGRDDGYLPEEAKWLWALLGDEDELACQRLSLSVFGSDPLGNYYLDPHLSRFGETTARNVTAPHGGRLATGFDQVLELDPAGRIVTVRQALTGNPLLPLCEQPVEIFRAVSAEDYREALDAARR